MKTSLFIIGLALGLAPACLAQIAAPEAFPHVDRTVTLEQAIALAKTQSPAVLQAKAFANAAERRFLAARTESAPKVSLTARATAGNSANMIVGSPPVQPDSMQMMPANGARDATVALSFPLFTGGGIQARIANARWMASGEQAAYSSVALNAATAAAIAYDQLVYADDVLAVEDQHVADQQEQLRVAQALYDVGKVPKFYLLRFSAELAKAQQREESAKAGQKKAQAELAAALGYDPGSSIKPASLESPVPQAPPLAVLRRQAIDAHPEIKTAAANQDAAAAEVRRAKSEFYPKLYAVARYDLRSADNPGGTAFGDGYTVGVSASIPVFDAGLRHRDLQAAQEQQTAMAEGASQARLDILSAVETSYADVQAARKNVALAEAAVESAKENYDVEMERFQAGKAIEVEILDGLTALVDARRAKAERILELGVSWARLKQATAGW